MRFKTTVALACGLLLALPVAEAQRRRSGRLGSLQVTATAMEILRTSGENVAGGAGRGSVITIRLRIRNAGRATVCAELAGQLKVLDEDRQTRQYAGTGETWWIENLAPREEVEREQVFAAAGTPAAIELLVQQTSQTQACGETPAGQPRPAPRPLRLSLEGLAEKPAKK